MLLTHRSDLVSQLRGLNCISESVKNESIRLINETLPPSTESREFALVAGQLLDGIDLTKPKRLDEVASGDKRRKAGAMTAPAFSFTCG